MAQVLWRLAPQEYFSVVPHFPLNHMPFLALCAPCSHRIEIERTHQVAWRLKRKAHDSDRRVVEPGCK